ncbi:MAG: AI-2E family transporter [Fusobacteriaceae bacterium]
MLQSRKGFMLKVGILLITVVVFQSFLQNGAELKNILNTVMGYIKPFIYAIFIAIILHPISKLLEDKFKMKRWLAITLSVVGVISILAALILAMVPGLSASIREIVEKAPEYEVTLTHWIEKALELLRAKGIIAIESNQLKTNIDTFLSGNKLNIFKSISVSFMGMIVIIGQVTLGFLLAIFFINDREYFEELVYNVIYIAMDKKRAKEAIVFLDKSRMIFLNYMWGKTLSSAGVAIIAFLAMLFTGVPYAGLIAVLLGVGNMIPYVGAIFAVTVGLVLVLIADPTKVAYLFIANGISQQLESIYISPKIIGKTVGLSSFWVITGVLLGGAVMGPLGMIFGVPVVGILKLIYSMRLEKKKNRRVEE